MSVRWLVDTNVLVYAHDVVEVGKQQRAIAILDQFTGTGGAALSTHILSEYFWVLTRKRAPPVPSAEAEQRLNHLVELWPVLAITPPIVLEAARGARQHQMAFWDALVWAAARLNQVPRILTEDFSDGRTVEGVTYVNPFVPSFSPAALR